MKIKKNQLLEKVLFESDDDITLSDVNPAEDSVDKIAAGLQGTVDQISNGEETVPDTSAQAAAAEIKKDAVDLGAGDIAVDDSLADTEEEGLGVENELTKKLDKALATALAGNRQGHRKNANVLVTGLPGSGKTSIVFDWAKSAGRKINVYDVSASDPDLEAAVYGLTLRDITSTDKNATTKASSDFLDALDKDNSVLFLDEFNRANSKLRRALLMLVNEHCIPDKNYPKGLRYFNNLLFTVACVNPGGLRTDKNAEPLNDAEKSRFALKVPRFDSNAATTIDYFTKHWNKLISKLDPKDPYYMQDLEEYLRNQDMGIFLVSNPDFQYDTKADLEDLFDFNRTMLNQRELTDGLDIAAGDLGEFKDWVTENSDFLDRDVEMILKILNQYRPPRLEDLIANKERETSINLAANTTNSNNGATEQPGGQESGDGSEEEIEDDGEFFGSSANGKSAPTPGEVESTVMSAIQGWI